MNKKKETRGAPKGNRNAAGKRGRKEYIPIFGQRWPVDVGQKILTYLERAGLSQKGYIDKQVQRDILNDEREQSDA